MTTEQIYVALLNEGTDVWRPVPAFPIDSSTFILLRPDDYDPELETWEFPPGTTVTCEKRKTRDGEILSAVRRVTVGRAQTA